MVITRTPLRVSLVGGGTDYPWYYEPHEGTTVTLAIDRYVYVVVGASFDGQVQVRMPGVATEYVGWATAVQNEYVRASMQSVGVSSGVEINIMSEVPLASGLGGSSAMVVGLLKALHIFKGDLAGDATDLPEEAYQVEANGVGKECGKQDQYAVALGGLKRLDFHGARPKVTALPHAAHVAKRLMLFNIGPRTADTEVLLHEQHARTSGNLDSLAALAALAKGAAKAIEAGLTEAVIGAIMHAAWEHKKQLSPLISNESIDRIYDIARSNGALGGKVSGAGSGGFMLLWVEPDRQEQVKYSMASMTCEELTFGVDALGSAMVYASPAR